MQTLNWYPTIKSNIERNLLEIYDKNKKLVYKLNIKPYKGVSVSAGFTRVIVYSGVDFYEDIIEQSGKKLSHIMRVGEDFIGQSREFIMESLYAIFGLQRKLIRDTRNIFNPEPYDIIHNDKYAKKDAHVRVGGSVACKQEKNVFYARQNFVKKAQEKFLGIKFGASEKPLVISFVASGGGQRALLCSAGSLFGAQNIGLLDCGTYLSALSGSTWFVAPWMLSGLSLSQWEKRIIDQANKDLVFKASDIVISNKRFLDQLQIKFAFGQPIGFVDIYGALLAARYLEGFGQKGDPNRCYLSSLADTTKMSSGKSLIPVFTAVTAEVALGHTWCEFTPWEFGSREFGTSGAYIPVWAFGRKFESLKTTKNWGSAINPLYEPMQSLGVLMGIWGLAPAATFSQVYDQALKDMKDDLVKDLFKLICKKNDLKKVRFIWADVNNFMYNSNLPLFSKYKYLKLADAGVKLINPIFSTYRRPEQGKNIMDGSSPDVIIIWDSGASESGLYELQAQSVYAFKHNHAFPLIDLDAADRSIINIFTRNPDSAKYKDYEVPTVIYLKRRLDKALLSKYAQDPVFKNMANRLKNFDLEACVKKGQCETFNFKYDEQTAQSLVDMTKFNTMVSIDKIKEALRKRLELNRVRDGAGFR
ncbi:MAG: hypothetical protein UR12_C0020G0001 [candidate division TM6 bacterium GW2011_GWF2_30_66]|nr:MAG: hypothetical protein UR12_C0020G0001 [candidate division TM6 bacterium GW2011_GWF2_30_66]